MKEFVLDATIENIEFLTAQVDEMLEEALCSPRAQMQIDVAIDELFSNIANYAYPGKIGKATVQVDISEENRTVTITFIDSGIQYDPLAKEDPDVTLSAEERKIGGLGIFMVKKTMDDIKYSYENGNNILTINKKI